MWCLIKQALWHCISFIFPQKIFFFLAHFQDNGQPPEPPHCSSSSEHPYSPPWAETRQIFPALYVSSSVLKRYLFFRAPTLQSRSIEKRGSHRMQGISVQHYILNPPILFCRKKRKLQKRNLGINTFTSSKTLIHPVPNGTLHLYSTSPFWKLTGVRQYCFLQNLFGKCLSLLQTF